jgi:hypothetical protein
MHVRVVRFTDVDPDRVEEMVSDIDGTGPPEGVRATGMQILLDREQRTSVVVQFFENAQDMADSEAALDGMDPGDTPGTRASVDRTKLVREFSATSA